MLDLVILSAFEEYRRLPLVAAIFDRLRRELPAVLTYHSYSHSEDVFDEAIRFAMIGRLQRREVELLAIAASFHDAGFISTPLANEPIAADLVVAEMVSCGGYQASEREVVRQMILDTALTSTAEGVRQQASLPLSGYLLDADLSNLGRSDFFEKGELLRKETGGETASFWQASLSFMKGHRWNTEPARAMRERKQRINIEVLEQQLAIGTVTTSG